MAKYSRVSKAIRFDEETLGMVDEYLESPVWKGKPGGPPDFSTLVRVALNAFLIEKLRER